MTSGQKLFVFIGVVGGAAWYLFKGRTALASSAPTATRAPLTSDQQGNAADPNYQMPGSQMYEGPSTSDAYYGQYGLWSNAAGAPLAADATLDNSRTFDTGEYDVYNAYHPNGEGPTLEGA